MARERDNTWGEFFWGVILFLALLTLLKDFSS